MRGDKKPYKIIGAYDSETTNYISGGIQRAFPILHQLGIIDCDISNVSVENVESVTEITLYRHTLDLYARLDELFSMNADYVPVIACHNLSFDMYGLSVWLNRHDVKVLAKSARKPITFTVLDENGNPALVIWDTLIFSQQSLERMGEDCGYSKGVGEWDYDLVRTPETELTDEEIDYSKRDIYTLLAWLGWWIRRNPDIESSKLGLNVVTKTGVVRERRRVRFDSLKGQGHKQNVGRYWLYRCRTEQPQSDDELYTMFAATRGGFTFCSSENASKPFDLAGTDEIISAYDATSQHPAQICSHYYPVNFKPQPAFVLDLAFNLVGKISFGRILAKWDKPIPVAFYACFEFTNLRPKAGSIFEKYGILPLASARYKTPEQIAEDNGDKQAYQDDMVSRDYCDCIQGGKCAFGKIISAEKARLYITELTAWEIWQCYDWDDVKAIHGYETGRFTRPSDMDVISVMQFYKAKDAFKTAREEYYATGTIFSAEKLKALGIAPAIADSMCDGSIHDVDVDATYLGLKSDLNSVFGISCSNQYRRQTVLSSTGIEYVGDFGICNAPKNPKVWYQFGQRIVGWSRIAQICAMLLVAPYARTIINGDTDSIKIVCAKSDLGAIDKQLEKLSSAIDEGKRKVCLRVKHGYPAQYDELEFIGHYVKEFETKQFCASWNKAYCLCDYDSRDGKPHYQFTLAGIPTRRRESANACFIGINGYADRLSALGWSFSQVTSLLLGYNVTYSHGVIRMNARKFPAWGDIYSDCVEDYKGDTSKVVEPCALAIYPMSKTINDTSSPDNRMNLSYAHKNNSNVNFEPKLVFSSGILDLEDLGDIFDG